MPLALGILAAANMTFDDIKGVNVSGLIPAANDFEAGKLDATSIERSNGRLMVQYRGVLMPLVHVSSYGEVRSEGKQPVLVFSDRGRSAGLMVDEIVDIVHQAMDGTAPDPSSVDKELGDYIKTVKVIMGETLFSDSYLEI